MHDDLLDSFVVAWVHHGERQVAAGIDVHRDDPQLRSQLGWNRVQNIFRHPRQRRSGNAGNLHVLLERRNQVLFIEQAETKDRLAQRTAITLLQRDRGIKPLGS
jgi:hypothetical protein